MDLSQIQERLGKVQELNGEMKVAREMLKSALENDAMYEQIAEEAKVTREKKKKLQEEIYNQPENQKIMSDLKASREELATLKEMLSEELIEYRNQHKTESITGPDGQSHIFKFSVRLTRHNQVM